METEELIEHILRQKHLEEMMNRPEKEHTPLEGMDNEQIKRFALFLFEENQSKSKQLDEMIARLDEIGKDLKESNKKIDSLTNALLKANSKADKVVLEYKLRDKEYKKLEKKVSCFLFHFTLPICFFLIYFIFSVSFLLLLIPFSILYTQKRKRIKFTVIK